MFQTPLRPSQSGTSFYGTRNAESNRPAERGCRPALFSMTPYSAQNSDERRTSITEETDRREMQESINALFDSVTKMQSGQDTMKEAVMQLVKQNQEKENQRQDYERRRPKKGNVPLELSSIFIQGL
ncbi:uncharacterized protein LOC144435161 [Glandiceps talaboti]